jgi:hypothetical protein
MTATVSCAAPVKTEARLFRLLFGPAYYGRWELENSFAALLRTKPRRALEDDVKTMFDYAVHRIGIRLLSELKEKLAAGQLILSSAHSFDPCGQARDLAAVGIRDVHLDPFSGRVTGASSGAEVFAIAKIR